MTEKSRLRRKECAEAHVDWTVEDWEIFSGLMKHGHQMAGLHRLLRERQDLTKNISEISMTNHNA